MKNVVISWFGDGFDALDPLLRELHREGGELSGAVDLTFGRGLAGFAGRRIAKKLGLPVTAGSKDLTVKISHEEGCLHWARNFDNQQNMVSVFRPQGHYPSGCWIESTGKLTLVLGVQIVDGGWYWVQQQLILFGVSLPLWLFPRTTAYKRISNGRYEFSVSVSLPVLGELVSYRGLLSPSVAGGGVGVGE